MYRLRLGFHPVERRSVTGYFLKLAGGIFSWQSRMQKSVAQSSTEAEYYALGDCCKQVLWIKSLLGELDYKLNAIPICGDNQGSIFMASNPVQERRSKHVDIRYHFIRDVVQSGAVELFYIEGERQSRRYVHQKLGPC